MVKDATGIDWRDTVDSENRIIADKVHAIVEAGPFFYFYDPPWTMPWNRRNEVAFDVQ